MYRDQTQYTTGRKNSGNPLPTASGIHLLLLGLLLIAVWLLGRWSAGGSRTGQQDSTWNSGPIVLAIRNIGQLHAASYTIRDTLRQESQRDPSGWARELPGVGDLVHWATRNEAIIAAEGTVEAGVDLSRLSEKDVMSVKRTDGVTVLRVHLPPITLYPPVVHLHVIHSQNGLFWRDENLVPSAQRRAAQLFQNAAEQTGIRQKAQENAIQTLQTLEQALGHHNVEFTF